MEIIEFDSVLSLKNNDLEGVLAAGFGGDFGVSNQAFISYRSKSLNSSLFQKEKTSGYLAKADGRCLGFIVVAFSQWDSEILGLPVGKVLWFNTLPAFKSEAGIQLLDTAFSKAREWKIECLMTRIDYNQNHLIHLLENNGFRLMDVSVALGTASEKIGPSLPTPEGSLVRPATTEDLPLLKKIARSNFRYSHFHMDPNLSQTKSNELFACWIENDVKGRADKVLLIEDQDQVAGFVTLNIDPNSEEALGFKIGEIDLIAVSAEHQGKGLGRHLVRAGLEWLRPQVRHVEARTQLMNHSALNTFTNNQFQLLNSGIFLPSGATLHGWLNRN
jgi:RimJ/RimL family protein N-acetyltransferase